MIQIGSVLNIADNTGAKKVKCINVLGGSNFATIGDTIVVSIKSILSYIIIIFILNK